MTYKWVKANVYVRRLADGACIPNDERNTDWQAFQKYVSEGGVVQPEDVPPPPDPRLVLDAEELAAAKLDAQLQNLLNMTPTEIGSAIDNAFPDPAQRVILKRICRVLLPTARKVFR